MSVRLVQGLVITLRKAALKYDLKVDYKFMAYAVWWVRQAMIQVINEKG